MAAWPRSTAIGIVLLLAACSAGPMESATVVRDGFEAVVRVSAWRAPETHGFLCPDAPASPVFGPAGRDALIRAGCLDLGLSGGPSPDAPGWEAVIHLESLASAQLEMFAGRERYAVVLLSPDGRRFIDEVASVNLVP